MISPAVSILGEGEKKGKLCSGRVSGIKLWELSPCRASLSAVLPSLSQNWEREGLGMGEGKYGDIRVESLKSMIDLQCGGR